MYSQASRHFTLAHPLLEQPRCRHPPLLQLLKVPPHTRCIPHSRRIAECIYIMQASIEAEQHYRAALVVLESLPNSPDRESRELTLQVALGHVIVATRGW